MPLLLPALVAIAIAVLAGLVPLPLRPSLTVPFLSLVAGVTAAMSFAALAVLVAGFVGGQHAVAAIAGMFGPGSPHYQDHSVAYVIGIPAVLALSTISWRIRSLLHVRRSAMESAGDKRLKIVDATEPLAYAVPGNPGCVVVSSGLLAKLEPRERQVVFAHERAHLEQCHDRYLLLAAMSQTVLPVLGPLVRKLRHATERCADEAAALAMGGDREVVATAIARAALAKSAHKGLLGSFGGGSVPARVDALLGVQQPPAVLALGLAVAGLAATGIVGATALQVYDLVELLAHVAGR